MNCNETTWNKICTELPKLAGAVLVQAQDTRSSSFRKLAKELSEKTSQPAKIQVLLQFCDSEVPKLMPSLAGTAEMEIGEPASDPLANPHDVESDPYYPMRLARQLSAALIICLAKICMSELIYPPIFFGEFLKHMASMTLSPKYGSGLFLDSPDFMVCASVARKMSTSCRRPGRVPCPHCKLVTYCSEACRKVHWDLAHEEVCTRALKDSATRNAQLKNHYAALLYGKGTTHPSPITVWDRAPAFGLLGDHVEEAGTAGTSRSALPNPLRLLFLDCYDLNNVIETLHQLDPKFQGEVTLYVNSPNMQVLARHILLWSLLLDMAEKTVDASAVDAVIAVWYSATLTPGQYVLLMHKVLQTLNTTTVLLPSQHPLQATPTFRVDNDLHSIQEDMIRLTHTFAPIQLDGILKQITCSGSSIVLRTTGLELWKYLTLMGIGCWDPDHATRQKNLSKYDRISGLDDFLQEPHFESLDSFREHGLALPYGNIYCSAHYIPNPTLVSAVDNPKAGWSVKCSRLDPLAGWPILEVVKSTRGPPCYVPENDLFGSHYFYVRKRILSVVEKLRRCRITLELTGYPRPRQELMGIWHDGPGLRSMYRVLGDYHRRFEGTPTSNSSIEQTSLQTFVNNRVVALSSDAEDYRLVMLYQIVRLDESPGADPYKCYDEVELTEEQVEHAMSAFEKFMTRCGKRSALVKKLRLYATAVRDRGSVPDMLTPLFLHQKLKPFITNVLSVIDNATSISASKKPAVASSIFSTSKKLIAVRAPSNVVMPLKPSLVYGQSNVETAAGSSRRKQGKPTSQMQERAPTGRAKTDFMTTAEECYLQVFFTLLNHFELFVEWQLKVAAIPDPETEPSVDDRSH